MQWYHSFCQCAVELTPASIDKYWTAYLTTIALVSTSYVTVASLRKIPIWENPECRMQKKKMSVVKLIGAKTSDFCWRMYVLRVYVCVWVVLWEWFTSNLNCRFIMSSSRMLLAAAPTKRQYYYVWNLCALRCHIQQMCSVILSNALRKIQETSAVNSTSSTSSLCMRCCRRIVLLYSVSAFFFLFIYSLRLFDAAERPKHQTTGRAASNE